MQTLRIVDRAKMLPDGVLSGIALLLVAVGLVALFAHRTVISGIVFVAAMTLGGMAFSERFDRHVLASEAARLHESLDEDERGRD